MKARVAASVVLALGIAVGTAGCNLIAPQETTKILQSTSYGIEGSVGSVDIRNAYVVEQDGAVNLVATFVNSGGSGATLSIQPNNSSADATSLLVAPGAPTVVGDATRVQWGDIDTKPGALLPVFFTYGDATGITLRLPVLTSDFAINQSLTPTPTPSATPAG